MSHPKPYMPKNTQYKWADPYGGNNEDLYLYKAKKYHYKCQAKLKEMMREGKDIPQGYEQYLQPFNSN